MVVTVTNPAGVFLVNPGRQLTVSTTIQHFGGTTGGLVLRGGGTVEFSAGNTYNGGTTINDATLLLTGPGAAPASGTGSGAVAVNTTGTLGGTGRVGGGVSVNTGGTLAPGVNGTGTLTLGGSTSFENGGRFAVQIGATGNSDAVTVDHVSSDLHFKNGSVLALSPVTGFVPTAPASYTVASVPTGRGAFILIDGQPTASNQVIGTYIEGTGPSGKVVIQPTGFTLSPGDRFELVRAGDTMALNFTPVPEPAAVLGLAAAGLGLGGLVRRRVRQRR
jgi:autotransporter-associated beta strand protein